MQSSTHINISPSIDSQLISMRCPVSSRGDDLLVGEVLTHLLRTLPLPEEDQTDPRMGVAENVQKLQMVMACQDVGTVGLYGMGGIGKTTVAEAFFAEQSKVPSFRQRVLLHVGQDAEDEMLVNRRAELCRLNAVLLVKRRSWLFPLNLRSCLADAFNVNAGTCAAGNVSSSSSSPAKLASVLLLSSRVLTACSLDGGSSECWKALGRCCLCWTTYGPTLS